MSRSLLVSAFAATLLIAVAATVLVAPVEASDENVYYIDEKGNGGDIQADSSRDKPSGVFIKLAIGLLAALGSLFLLKTFIKSRKKEEQDN